MEKTKKDQTTEDRRLWIGNLDPRVTEGYAFVTYIDKDDAARAKEVLNNVLVGQRNIMVTWAHSVNNEDVEKPRPEINIPALAMSKNEKKTDRVSQIQAIEAKLKLMERKAEDELKINDTVATKPPVISQFQYNKQGVTNNNLKTKTSVRRHDKYSKPYSKQKVHR
ncbi:RRM 1 domain containing protein [Asbolus verrucosus]|uniref:RRM 1 domain containing protein n=1 Tax=Asbolus verrucosus TaxID=1661398 RepID=A0A482W000_ASBVE|nr:RRM 1 domain containing protein [Asbolus verrucosus]